MDLFSNQVYVFSPKGEVMELPAGSTPLDFAFKIHSDVGVKCVGAKVNGKMVPIDYELENGEIIEIITSNNSKGPSIDWLKIAKSSSARSKIRQWLKRQDKSLNVDKGKEMLEKTVRRKGYDPKDFVRSSWITKIAKTLKYGNPDDLYTTISYGGTIISKVINLLLEYHSLEVEKNNPPDDAAIIEKTNKKRKPSNSGNGCNVVVAGVDNLLIRLSKCCNPVPGDDIVGFITKGRGVSVHRVDCSNIISLPEEEKARLIDVEWDSSEDSGNYDADIFIHSVDRKGLFNDLSRKCVDMDVNISGVNLKINNDNTADILMTLSISNTNQMEKILRNLQQVESVLEVYRART
jgi:GTP pyrophosphokinase